mgnify:CR=1 FL=1
MNIDLKVFNSNIFDNVLFFTTIATINVIVANMYDRIFFVFLSFFVNIGKFTVSAGAYELIIIIENINVTKITMYFVYTGVQVIYLLIKTFP